MKKIFLSIFALGCLMLQAQQIKLNEGQPAIIYSLPKTEVCIELEIEKTITKPGPYFQYSERYLATSSVVTSETVNYRLIASRFITRPVADALRTFVLHPDKKSVLNQLTVNKQGILCGINVAAKSTLSGYDSGLKYNADKALTENLLPLGEEFMMAGSVAKLAEGAAKQIYRIRESRLSLLTGDVEHMPADGSSLQTMLSGLQKSEQELTELFTGKVSKSIEKRYIPIAADKEMKEQVAFRLSVFKGLVEADDLTGEPYFVNLTAEKRIETVPAVKNAEFSTIHTVYPVSASFELTDGVKTLSTLRTELPQMGVLLPVSAEILSTPGLKLSVDPSNGRLLSVEKGK